MVIAGNLPCFGLKPRNGMEFIPFRKKKKIVRCKRRILGENVKNAISIYIYKPGILRILNLCQNW